MLLWGLLLEGRCYGNNKKSVIRIQPASGKGAVWASWCGGLTFSCVSSREKASKELPHEVDSHIAETQIRPMLLILPSPILHQGKPKATVLMDRFGIKQEREKEHNSLF